MRVSLFKGEEGDEGIVVESFALIKWVRRTH